MGKKSKTKRRQVKTKPSGSQSGAEQNQRRTRADRKPSGGRYDVVFAVLPTLIIVLAVLWDWATRLLSDGWHENSDVSIFMFVGQRLLEGILNWTQVFYETKPLIVQFLFAFPALFNSYNVWYLMSMGFCLIGAYSVYAIMRDMFSEARGFSRNTGRYAGIYGGVFTLYLFSVAYWPHHINASAVSMALIAAVLTKRYLTTAHSGEKRKTAILFLACFCASVAVGLRPYLLVFVGLIPLWISISAQLNGENGRIKYRSTVWFAFVWNACVGLFALSVNVLPYIVTGEWASFTAGIEMMDQRIALYGWEWILSELTVVYNKLGLFSTLLFFSWAAFLILFLTGAANRLYNRAVAFDLLMLTAIMPFSILGMTFAKNFWNHYTHFFAPSIGIGSASLFVLLDGKRTFRFLFRYKAIAVIPALFFVLPQLTELRTKFHDHYMVPTVQNLSALLDRHGLEKGDFLAPYNDYVHVKFNQNKHGFPNAALSVDITVRGWWQGVNIPPHFRIPRNSREYCQMLDEQGPQMLVFFKYTEYLGYFEHLRQEISSRHLANCNFRNYDRYDLSDRARSPSDVVYYFIRREKV